MININTQMGTSAVARTLDADGNVITEVPVAKNLLLDAFLTGLNGAEHYTYAYRTMPTTLRLGDSATPSLASMTAIQGPITSTTGETGACIKSPAIADSYVDVDEGGTMFRVFTRVLTYTAPLGYIVGPVREVGLTWGTDVNTNEVCTRVVLDSEVVGDAQNQLQIDYKWTVKIPHTTSAVVQADLDGVTTPITVTCYLSNATEIQEHLRLVGAASYLKAATVSYDETRVPALFASMSSAGGRLSPTASTADYYFDLATKTIGVDLVFGAASIPLNNGEKIYWLGYGNYYQSVPMHISFSPGVPCTGQQDLRIGIRKTFTSL